MREEEQGEQGETGHEMKGEGTRRANDEERKRGGKMRQSRRREMRGEEESVNKSNQ